MNQIISKLQEPKFQVRLWALCTLMWLLLTPVTMLTVLAHSVPWLEFMSLFANSASCATAFVAALALLRAANADAQTRHIIEHHPEIPEMP